ncbi:maleylpyruvate isomerase family mycothiol-dependent enzyme [Mycolicibacterium hodleri]|uniref:Maleylpyruvate isomerase family mycothiol-dependent enzyme n=1 Tax=Mycolicibacterium hodleri TaxID=49897 RepID=A0A502E730_9MYCO|nr:maleylpyruvate isomerase family mycothiol-dependent enzyme [Mycolicibacterium hodleri]TPG32769.1 maleylpyruvate isomerase family mycothiol-dependent enzyme [Mycolicibacterium hodleri]
MTERPRTKLDQAEILTGLFAVWDDIDGILTDLPENRWRSPTPLPGWCVHDVVAHVVGTESMLAGIPTPEADIEVSTLEHVRNPIGVMNECWVRHLDGETGAAVLLRFRDVTASRRETLTAMNHDDWNALTATPAGPDSYGRFMRVRLFDCWMHEQDIREALARPSSDGDLDTPAARLALDEMVASMGFVVGKLGKAPDGSRVSIELTGPLARTIRVAVDGRATLVDDFDAQPTTAIRLDGLQFTRLAGGRPMSTARSTALEIDGDAEVGQRIVDNLAYVI